MVPARAAAGLNLMPNATPRIDAGYPTGLDQHLGRVAARDLAESPKYRRRFGGPSPQIRIDGKWRSVHQAMMTGDGLISLMLSEGATITLDAGQSCVVRA